MREHLALKLGGEIQGAYAKKVACPSCARPSVWFVIEPTQKAGAECAHVNSCGWQGPLEAL